MAEKKQLRIKRHYSIIAHSPNIVELRYGIWNPVSFSLTDESESGHLFSLLSRLDGSLSPAELAKQEGIPQAEVEALIDHLIQLGAVETGSSNVLDYYLDQFVPTLGQGLNPESTYPPVVLIGESDLTGVIEHYLRQSLPDVNISVAQHHDPALSVLSENEIGWLMSGIEFQKKITVFEEWRNKFLIVAAKTINPVQLRILNRISLELRIPWIHAAMDGPFLFVGPVFLPHRTACYECFETRVTMNLREAASYQQYKRAIVEGRIKYGSIPVEPVLLGILGSYTAFEVLNYLLTQYTFTVSKVLAIYLPTMEFTFNEVLKVPGCPACSPVTEREGKKLYFDMRSLIEK